MSSVSSKKKRHKEKGTGRGKRYRPVLFFGVNGHEIPREIHGKRTRQNGVFLLIYMMVVIRIQTR